MGKYKEFAREIVDNAHNQTHAEIVKRARKLLAVCPKFQIGDKVRLKGGFIYDNYKPGEYDTIKRITEDGQYVLEGGLPMAWHEGQLEAYTTEAPQSAGGREE